MHKVVITVFLVICVIAATFAARLGHGSDSLDNSV